MVTLLWFKACSASIFIFPSDRWNIILCPLFSIILISLLNLLNHWLLKELMLSELCHRMLRLSQRRQGSPTRIHFIMHLCVGFDTSRSKGYGITWLLVIGDGGIVSLCCCICFVHWGIIDCVAVSDILILGSSSYNWMDFLLAHQLFLVLNIWFLKWF